MTAILNQSLFKNSSYKQREYFPRSKAFYQSDRLFVKISKVVFPIFIACFLANLIRDGIDIAFRKKHFKKLSTANRLKEKSIQFLSKYGSTLLALGALGTAGYFAYNFLNTEIVKSVAKKIIPNEPLYPIDSPPEHSLITRVQNLTKPLVDVITDKIPIPQNATKVIEALIEPKPQTLASCDSTWFGLIAMYALAPFAVASLGIAKNVLRPQRAEPEDRRQAAQDLGNDNGDPNGFTQIDSAGESGLLDIGGRSIFDDDSPGSNGDQCAFRPKPSPPLSPVRSDTDELERFPASSEFPGNVSPSDLVGKGVQGLKPDNLTTSSSSSSLDFSHHDDLENYGRISRNQIGNGNLNVVGGGPISAGASVNSSPMSISDLDPFSSTDSSPSNRGSQSSSISPVLTSSSRGADDLEPEPSFGVDPFVPDYLSESWESIPESRPEPEYKPEDRHTITMPQYKMKAQELLIFNYLSDSRVVSEINQVGGHQFYESNKTNPTACQNQSFLVKLYFCAAILEDENYIGESTRYYNFIAFLREVLKHQQDENLTNFEKGAMQSLEELAYFRFVETSLYGYLHDIVRGALHVENDEAIVNNFPFPDEFQFQKLAQLLYEQNKIIHSQIKKFESFEAFLKMLHVNWGKFKGASGFLFDPQSENNIPHPRSWFTVQTAAGEKDVIHLRHSTTTQQDYTTTATAIEEYEGFLRRAASKDQAVGYFNHQDQSSGSESERVRAIKELEERHDNIHIWSLPFDGDVFALVKNVKEPSMGANLTAFATMSDKEYKNRLIDEFFRFDGKLFSDKGTQDNDLYSEYQPETEDKSAQPEQPIRFAIPSFFRKNPDSMPVLRTDLTDLLNHVHKIYFNEKDLSNNAKERRLMVLFFYAHLVDLMASKLNLKFVVTACKDNKDRGGAMTAICETLRMIRTNRHHDPRLLETLFTHVLGVGLLTKDEHILGHRLMFLTDALDYLSSLRDEDITRIQSSDNNAYFGEVKGFGFRDDTLREHNPFAVSTHDEFDKQLQRHINGQIKHVDSFDFEEFEKIFSTYSDKGALRPHSIYNQLNKDKNRFKSITIITDDYPEGYACKNKDDLLNILGLPQIPDEVDLQKNEKALKFLILAVQSSGGVGSEILLNDHKLKEALDNLEIIVKCESGKIENTHLLSKGTFKKDGTCELTFENRYEFFSIAQSRPLARIPFKTTFNLLHREIRYGWSVVSI